MDANEMLALALDPALILKKQGMEPDPWQREVLLSPARNILLNCCRGAGKSRTTSALALHTALFKPKSLTLLISRAQRQAYELFRYVKQGYAALGRPIPALKETETTLELTNGSRVVCLPGKEETIRSFQGVNLLVIDEASRVPDDLYGSVSPMTGVSQGRTLCLSTPFGQRGFFWKEWFDADADWVRFRVPGTRCPRLTKEFIDGERRFGDSWVAQEYDCSFEAMEGVVYAGFEDRCGTNIMAPPGLVVGGIDFGFRNPFAALWGTLRDDVLWIDHEIYVRETALPELLDRLPRRGVEWYADPAGADEIKQLLMAGYKVRRGKNEVRPGIAAVKARIESGRLKVNTLRCPNLLSEVKLYHYNPEGNKEEPAKEYDHALDALHYLVSRIDARFLAKYRRGVTAPEPPDPFTPLRDPQETQELLYSARPKHERPWLRLDNEAPWQ